MAAQESLPELDATRVLRTSLAEAWRAWTEAERVALWWGPAGFTNPVCRWDARPGGAIYVEMKGPDGTVYPMDGTFEAVEPLRRLVFRTRALDAKGAAILEGRNEASFEDLGGGRVRLRLRVRLLFVSEAGKAHVQGMNVGWNMSLDKLEDLYDRGERLARQGVSEPSETELLFRRVLRASRAEVWDAWMDPDKVARWWGPEGFSIDRPEREVKPGGTWRFVMRGPAGVEFPNLITYREVESGRLLAYDLGDGERVLFRATVRFGEHPEGTELTKRFTFPDRESRDRTAVFAVPGNASEMERLERLLRGA